ncbi:MAG TPA: hypothetical protein EYG88_02225 [Desulfocapsa sulfexigens]|nr:hypothetical protein [Desulfocapsa sulfexigens]
MNYSNVEDIPPEKWLELNKKKIYFGHQSVGFNIIDGIELVMKEHPVIQLNIIEGRKFDGPEGAFVHSRVGKNRDPESKIIDFTNVIDKELGQTPDAAALKFCYVDAYDKINVNNIFLKYKDATEKLKKDNTGLTIIHFTMPLHTQKITWKTKVKLLAGRDAWEFHDNIKRNEFNKLLLAEYKGKEPVFDIARFEATTPDGSTIGFQYKGEEYFAVNPEYSEDGGHLNVIGRKRIAENFLLFLINELL